jgi:cell fate (sporulation/competence/biofilm development) regulator YmcA (YheA/YmcA/DUF963 family)
MSGGSKKSSPKDPHVPDEEVSLRQVKKPAKQQSSVDQLEIKEEPRSFANVASSLITKPSGSSDVLAVFKFGDNISQDFLKLKAYVSNSALINQRAMRTSHDLIKGTVKSLGFPGAFIVKLATDLGIKVTETMGTEVIAKNSLLAAFTDSGLNQNFKPADEEVGQAVNSLASLAHNLVTFSELPVFIKSDDYSFIYTRFHYVAHIQKVFYDNNISDYLSHLRIGSDHKTDLINSLKLFGTVASTELFIDLIEKIIERVIISAKKETLQTNELLRACRTHFLSLAKAYEKNLPSIKKVKLSEAAKKRLAKNSRARITDNDKITILVKTRPALETKGFLNDLEKEELSKFNTKLNELSHHIDEIPVVEGYVRRKITHNMIQCLFAKTSHVNKVISRRKTLVHQLMVDERKRSHDPLEQKALADKTPFTPDQWRRGFSLLDKTDLKTALIESFGSERSANLVPKSLIKELMAEIPHEPSKLATSSESEEASISLTADKTISME